MLIARTIFPPTGTRQTKEVITILNYVRPFVCLCSSASLILQYGGYKRAVCCLLLSFFIYPVLLNIADVSSIDFRVDKVI